MTEQQKIRRMAKEELAHLEKIMNNNETVQLLDRFKNTFNLCESTYKVILKEHQRKKNSKIPKHLKLVMTQVPYAMGFAGYSIDKDLLNRIFGSKCEKGHTAKKLRDAITHGLDIKAIKEIEERQKELFSDMNTFLNIIRES